MKGDDDVARTSTRPTQVRAGINMTYTALLATVYYVGEVGARSRRSRPTPAWRGRSRSPRPRAAS